jgi:hypothetical protein
MNRHRAILALLASAMVSLTAAGHPATELYIPIGKSPGISHVKSWIGQIQSLAATQVGFTMMVNDDAKYVAFDESTKIYLQYETPGKNNELGNYTDCKAGRTAEVYLADDGKANWIKVLMP